MDAYLFGRFGGDVRGFSLPEERGEFDRWAVHCRMTVRNTEEFDNLHRMVKSYVDAAAEAMADGKFVSIHWTDGTAGEAPLVVEYHFLPHEVKENSHG